MAQKPEKVARSIMADPAAPVAPAPQAVPAARVPMTAPVREAGPEPVAEQAADAPQRVSARVPMGRQSQQLAYADRPGFKRRWFNDKPGRIQRCLSAGYTHVLDGAGRNVSRIVGKEERGAGLTGYLMEIPQEFYDEDFAAKQESLNETDQRVYGSEHLSEKERYIPESGTSFNVKRGPGLAR